MPSPMSVDKLQEAEEAVAQRREQAERDEREARSRELRQPPVAATAGKPHHTVATALAHVRTMTNMRTGPLADVHELAVSIKETGLLHPPLVRATGEDAQPYELLAGQRRFAAMQLLDEADGAREDWRFTLVDGISRREALTMQFAENFHQSRPEPIQFARAARLIMHEDPSLTAAEVSRLVGAPASWTRKALRLLELPDAIVERVERGDLSFTAADLVRRGIARGDVSAEAAEELVERHAEGTLSGTELKFGVGYVPPPPANYEEISERLDAARRESGRGERAADDGGSDAEQRDWESGAGGGTASPARGGEAPFGAGGADAGTARPAPAHDPSVLDAYLLGVVLARIAPERRRTVLRIAGEADAHEYARSLLPQERLATLRSIAAELLEADPAPPRALRRAS